MKEMKVLRFISFAVVVGCLALTGCRDGAETPLTGAYTYKTGGKLKVLPSMLASGSVEAVEACSELTGYDLKNLWAPLMPESGELTLVYTNEARDSVIVTFTALLGDLCTLSGTVSGDSVMLTGIKSMQLTDGSSSLGGALVTDTRSGGMTGGGFVTVTADGKLYENVLILNLSYDGTISTSAMGRTTEMTITDSRIQCVAQTISSERIHNYYYKTGGQVKLLPTVLTDSLVMAVDACSELCGIDLSDLWLALKPESGALTIAGTGNDGDLLTLSFNTLLGDVCTMKGTQNGDRLVLTDDNEKSFQLTDGEETIGGGITTVSGSGSLTDDLLLLDLNYRGTLLYEGLGRPLEFTITDSKVECHAKRMD